MISEVLQFIKQHGEYIGFLFVTGGVIGEIFLFGKRLMAKEKESDKG